MPIVYEDQAPPRRKIVYEDEPLLENPMNTVFEHMRPGIRPMGSGVSQMATDYANKVYDKAKGRALEMIPENIQTGAGKAVRSLIPGGNLIPQLDKFDKPLGKAGLGVGIDASASLGTEVSGPLAKGASKVTSKVAKGAEDLGGRLLNFYIKPRAAGYKFGSNPGRGVVKHVGPKMSKESLKEGIVSAKDRLLKELEESAKVSNDPVDATPIFEEIGSVVNRLKDFPELYADQIESHKSLARDIMAKVAQNGYAKNNRIYVNPVDAVKIKRAIGDIPSWTVNDPKLGSITKTSRGVYGKFDREIDKVLPGSKEMNQDVSDLIGAEKGIDLGMQREQNKHPLGILDWGIGAIVGAHGGGPVGVLQGALASKAVRSAPFNTTAGATFGAIGKAGRKTADVMKSVESPEILKQISALFRKPQTGVSTVPRPSGRPMPDMPQALPRNRASEVSRQLPDAISTGKPAIPQPGPSPTIELPQYLESDLKRMAGEYGVPTYGDGPRQVISEFPKVPRTSLTPNKAKAIFDLLKRRRSNFGS